MEEHRGPRLVMQRQLEVEPKAPASPSTGEASPEPPSGPASEPTVEAPTAGPPSNQALLERQLRWYRERAKFESRRPGEEEPR